MPAGVSPGPLPLLLPLLPLQGLQGLHSSPQLQGTWSRRVGPGRVVRVVRQVRGVSGTLCCCCDSDRAEAFKPPVYERKGILSCERGQTRVCGGGGGGCVWWTHDLLWL